MCMVDGRELNERDRLLTGLSSDRTRGSEHKLKHRWLPLNIRKHFAVRVTEHRLPRKFIGFSSLEIFRSCLDTQWLDQIMSRGPFQVGHSVILFACLRV